MLQSGGWFQEFFAIVANCLNLSCHISVFISISLIAMIYQKSKSCSSINQNHPCLNFWQGGVGCVNAG
ncbi:hypothetical protein B0189_03425 [Moraxella cuniculi]|nr:hypothetical protein B0189_03425 [Moraxella cuniculi]